jgi:hypothetical protein
VKSTSKRFLDIPHFTKDGAGRYLDGAVVLQSSERLPNSKRVERMRRPKNFSS